MSQIIPIYIPTLISDVNYNPTKVYPRLFFYNGLVECEPYWFQYKAASGSATINNIEVSEFPYCDHYNVVTGSFPTGNSLSLLFQNETPVYGSIPTGSLYSDYWETYINLLYNPKTRLINCSGIIPLADYFKMELNDIVEWRGNYYHLRAINEYNLTTGDCQLQLLGPIIKDTFTSQYDCEFDFSISDMTTTTTTTLAPTTTTTTTDGPTTTTTTRLPNNISRIGECLPNQIYTEYTLTGNPGDVIVVRGTFSGQIRKEGFTGQATAVLSVGSSTGGSSCFNDDSYHYVSVVRDETYTLTGTSIVASTSAVTYNSFETLMSLSVRILTVNGEPYLGSDVSGCRGDSTGGPC